MLPPWFTALPHAGGNGGITLKTIYKVYCRIEEIIVGLGFMTIVTLTFLNAVLRVLNQPIIVADDISLLLFSWVAFLGADVALRYSRLVGMDILVNKLHPKAQKTLQIVVYLIMIGALGVFANYGYHLALNNWTRTYNTLPISYGWVTLSLPVCSALMAFTCITKIFKVVKHFGDDAYNVRKDNPQYGVDVSMDASAPDNGGSSALNA